MQSAERLKPIECTYNGVRRGHTMPTFGSAGVLGLFPGLPGAWGSTGGEWRCALAIYELNDDDEIVPGGGLQRWKWSLS